MSPPRANTLTLYSRAISSAAMCVRSASDSGMDSVATGTPACTAASTPRAGKSTSPTARIFLGSVTLTSPSSLTSSLSSASRCSALSVGSASPAATSHQLSCTRSSASAASAPYTACRTRSTMASTYSPPLYPSWNWLGTSRVSSWILLGPRSFSYLRLNAPSTFSAPSYTDALLAASPNRPRSEVCGKPGPDTSNVVRPASASANSEPIQPTREVGSS
mmetsp:Transcript_7351/g.18240  ORF Transcript_7351/g.18240 Transcript_7351/m.18240 type:complete len:219 (+) Transcript_7351:716-1372(+)